MLATSELIQSLINGKQVTSIVNEGEYKYFSLKVDMPEVMLFIGVMPLSDRSNPDVYVNFAGPLES